MIDEEETSALYLNQGIAELIGVPLDIDIEKIKKHFPFINKQMHFGNMSSNEILDIKDDLHVKNILSRSKMTRGEKSRMYDRSDFIDVRAYLTAGLSLSRGGFLTKRITGTYRNIQTSENNQQPKKGLFGNVFKRGGDFE